MKTTDTVPYDDHGISYAVLRSVLERIAVSPVPGYATLYVASCTDPRIFAFEEARTPTLEVFASTNQYKLILWVSRGSVLVTFHHKDLEFNPAHTRILELANPASIDTLFSIVDHYLAIP